MDDSKRPPPGHSSEVTYQRRLLVNATMSAVQVVVVGITFVVLYRYVLDSLGAGEFGVWAVVLATTSIGQIANLGLAAGAVKFVAQYLAREDRERLRLVVQTSVISLGVVLGVLILALYPLLRVLLKYAIEPAAFVPAAHMILPYALGAFWLTAVSAVVQSCIDGLHRVYLRNLLLIGASIAYLLFAFALVPSFGLKGLALAQVAQAGLLLIASWLVLRRIVPALPLIPIAWTRSVFTEMLSYGLKFQAISVAQVMFEPMAKVLLSKFGGVASVSSFEFAHRMVVQLRALVTTAHQAIVPAIAHLHERNPETLRSLYVRSFRLLLFLISATLPLLMALTPDVSRLWIGSLDRSFVVFANLLLAGWFFNMLANPAYFANMGTGTLKWNVLGQMLITTVFLLLGAVLGALTGGDGVVFAYTIALLLGSATIAGAYQRAHEIPMGILVDAQTRVLGMSSVLALVLVVALGSSLEAHFSTPVRATLIVLIYAIVVAVPLLRHSMWREMQTLIRRAFVAA